MSPAAEIWVCTECGVARSGESARFFLILGWELVSLRRVNGRRAALCPRCNGHREHAS
jgi:hypothetical protein